MHKSGICVDLRAPNMPVLVFHCETCRTMEPELTANLLAGVLIALGLILCFAGDYIFPVFVFTAGAIAGGFGGLGTVAVLYDAGVTIPEAGELGIILAISLIVATLFLKFPRIAVFFCGATSAAFYASIILNAAFPTTSFDESFTTENAILTGVIAVVGGIAALITFSSIVVKIMTSAIGSYSVVSGVFQLLYQFDVIDSTPLNLFAYYLKSEEMYPSTCTGDVCTAFVVSFAVLVVLGLLVQLKHNRHSEFDYAYHRVDPRSLYGYRRSPVAGEERLLPSNGDQSDMRYV